MAASWSNQTPYPVVRSTPWDGEQAVPLLEDVHLHGELDAVCPRCMRWIEERDFVRRTAYGPLQHEVCPEPLGPST